MRMQKRREFLKVVSLAGGSLAMIPLAAAEEDQPVPAKQAPSNAEKVAYRERTRWFHKARFGMFIH